MSTNRKTLTVKEAAKRSGYSEQHLRHLLRSGELECAEKIGQMYLIDPGVLDAYVEKLKAWGQDRYAPKYEKAKVK